MKELTIIGGGLAGLSLGIGLRKQGVPVRIIERGRFPQHKVCGEFISGVRDEVLDELGITEVLSDAELLDQMSWWIGGNKVTNERLPSPARGISRYELDQRLAALFLQLGGVLKLQTTWRGEKAEGTVDATGRNKRGSQKWRGLKVHFSELQLEGLEMHCGDGGYAGLASIGHGRVNVCALFELRRELKERCLLEKYMRSNGLEYLADKLDEAMRDDSSASAIAGFDFGSQDSTEVFAVGDAQYSIPPFSGNGMSMALESSAMALPFLRNYADGSANWHEVSEGYRQVKKFYFKKRCALAAGLHPLFFNSFSHSVLAQLGKRSLLPTTFLFNQLRTP